MPRGTSTHVTRGPELMAGSGEASWKKSLLLRKRFGINQVKEKVFQVEETAFIKAFSQK